MACFQTRPSDGGRMTLWSAVGAEKQGNGSVFESNETECGIFQLFPSSAICATQLTVTPVVWFNNRIKY